ncbi:MAG: ABC transporter permease, partial [Raoultibacter sp.]
MRGAFNKELTRSITRSLGRFLAIAIIVALGTGFYAGLRMTAPDMNLAADRYYDGTELYDIRVLSTYGLTDDDIDALKDIEGVSAVMPAYETDVMALLNGEQYVTRIHSLDVAAAQTSDTTDGVQAVSDDDTYINRPLLVSGTWPEKAGECVISDDVVMATPAKVGDTIEITEGTQDLGETLSTKTYTITGFVRSSYYTSSSTLGTTSLGAGSVHQIMYVPESDFSPDLPYTEAFLTVTGAKSELSASGAYSEKINEVLKRIEDVAPDLEARRLVEIKEEAEQTLNESRTEFEREKADAEQQLADAQKTLEEARQTLDDSKMQLADAAAQIAASERQLESGAAEYQSGVAELANRKAEAQVGFAEADIFIAQQQSELEAGYAQLEQLKQQYASIEAQLAQLTPDDPSRPALEAAKAQLEQVMVPLESQLSLGTEQLNGAKAELENRKNEAEAGFAQAQVSLDSAQATLASGKLQLANARQQLADGQQQYEDGEAEYAAGLKEYETKKAEADEKLADAQKKLDDAQADIDALEAPSWYVMDRSKNVGAESFKSDASRVNQIAQVFPFIFFLVAALVALTTMTRMVEEERILIGTFKALGYGRGRIASKYLLYAALASGAGSLLGIISFSQLLPSVIFNAYGIIYAVPTGPTPIDPMLASLSAALGIGVTLIATLAAVLSTLREQPAALMLPRTPKAGKRILLERMGFIWKHLSFSWKVTFRNIFRYKKRFIMTIIGIAGCTALLLTGLGLNDAINDIIAKQFGDIYKYNTTAGLVEDVSDKDADAISAILNDSELVESSTYADTISMTAETPDHKGQSVHVVIPEDPAAFQHFITMRERVGHKPLELTGDAVIISEKLATELGISPGDTMRVVEQDMIGNATEDGFDVTVTGIMENYVS